MMMTAPPSVKAKAAARKSTASAAAAASGKPKAPDLLDYVNKRDYTGALAVLEFERRSGEESKLQELLMWIGYCAFHVGR